MNRREPFDCVITSSPPESVHAVGHALSKRGVAWVADLRDAWAFEPIRPPFPTSAQRRLDEALERRWLTAAEGVVCVSRPVADDLRQRLDIDPALVPNGWDPDLTASEQGGDATSLLDPGRVSLLYTGRFGSYGRDPAPLVQALTELAHSDPRTAARLELVVAGPLTDAEAALMGTDVAPARIVVAGSLPRSTALALQRSADALLLLASTRRTQLLNFKLFEYLASEKPILALAAGTEAGRVVKELGGETVPSDDPPAIADSLRRLVAGEVRTLDAAAVTAYTYPRPAERMAEIAERAVAAARS
jgi:glycosyltransferase involved in cell wall biosynthesis